MNDGEPRWADRKRAERRAEVLQLRGEGLTVREIADTMGISVGTAHGDLTGENGESTAAEDDAASTALATAVATPPRAPVPLDTLRSGAMPAGTADEDIDAGSIADKILNRQHAPWRM